MDANLYLPPALPLMSDVELVRLKREYEAAHAETMKANDPASERKQRLLRLAIEDIGAELHARGIEGEPWWVTRSPAPARPPRRLGHTPPARQPLDAYRP